MSIRPAILLFCLSTAACSNCADEPKKPQESTQPQPALTSTQLTAPQKVKGLGAFFAGDADADGGP